MALLLKKLVKAYIYVNEELSDPRTNTYFLISSPIYLVTIISVYLLFVLKWGPEFMKNRKPYNLKTIIIIFNIVQILLCGYLLIQFMTKAFFILSWKCSPIDYSTDELPNAYAFYTWVYFLIKILDLLDTVFFVLRKKFNQITFLHLYHHSGMVVMLWVGTKFIAGGHGLFIGFINCIVHVCMYFYYLISIWDEKYKKSVWWKKYITQLQIFQFAFLAVLFGQTLLQTDCNYPRWIVIIFLPQNLFMTAMFTDFYYKAYVKPKKQQAATTSEPKEIISSKAD